MYDHLLESNYFQNSGCGRIVLKRIERKYLLRMRTSLNWLKSVVAMEHVVLPVVVLNIWVLLPQSCRMKLVVKVYTILTVNCTVEPPACIRGRLYQHFPRIKFHIFHPVTSYTRINMVQLQPFVLDS